MKINRKIYVLWILLMLVMTSCNDDHEVTPKTYPQVWQIITVNGIPTEELPERFAISDTYVLLESNSFLRFQQLSDTSYHEGGVFQIIDDELILTYDNSDSDVIGSCYADSKEYLFFKEDTLFNTWDFCDGPALAYKEIK